MLSFSINNLQLKPEFQMSKWNKPGKEPSEQFLQNEERRRQMIVQAARRRREKEKKLQQLNDDIKKKQQEALIRHKQQKKQAYSKYLRNNMHDKYEYKKRVEKMQEQTIKDVSKWKRKGKSEQKNQMPLRTKNQSRPIEQINKNKTVDHPMQKKPQQKMNPAKKAMVDQFQKEWGEELQKEQDDLINSKLLDSLDLDFDTIQRCQNINSQMKKTTQKQKQNQINAVNEELQQIKQMIGYESMVGNSMMDLQSQIASRKEKSQIEFVGDTKKSEKNSKKKEVNQQQTFNNLKHKKQGKILEWAGPEVEEADDLFSHCSSKNKMATIPEITNKVSSRKVLQPIPQKKILNRSEQKRNNSQNRSLQKRAEVRQDKKTKANVNVTVPSAPNFKKQQNRDKSASKRAPVERTNVRQPVLNTQSTSQDRQRVNSQQKNRSQQHFNKNDKSVQKKPAKTQQSFKVHKNPPIPVIPRPTESVATHQQMFDIQSFIKHDLNNINEEQRRLQEQIRDLHIANKGKIKQIEQKHAIKTNLKKTDNLLKHLHGQTDGNQDYSGQSRLFKNQDDIEDSIERLDDLLIRRDLQTRERPLTHITQESHLKSSGITSIIDPMGRPQDLHKQILQLAENISRFEEEPAEDAPGYGYNKRMMKKKKQASFEKPSVTQNSHKYSQGYGKNKAYDGSREIHGPPVLQYSSKEKMPQNQSIFEDSLDTMEKGKIQVNEKLRNLLFD